MGRGFLALGVVAGLCGGCDFGFNPPLNDLPLEVPVARELDRGSDTAEFERADTAGMVSAFSWEGADVVPLRATVAEVSWLREISVDDNVRGVCGEVVVRLEIGDGELDIELPADLRWDEGATRTEMILRPGPNALDLEASVFPEASSGWRVAGIDIDYEESTSIALRSWQVREDCTADLQHCPDQAFNPLGSFGIPERKEFDWHCAEVE